MESYREGEIVMGIITFWGPWHGMGVTLNTAAIAGVCSQHYQIRTLTAQPQWGDASLQHAFSKAIGKYNREIANTTGTGLDSLERVVRSNKLDRDSVKNNSLLIEPDRLDFLQGSMKLTKEQFDESNKMLELIFVKAKEYYNTILLDLHSGINNKVTQNLVRESDLVVVCLTQNIAVLDWYFLNRANRPEFLNGKQQVVIIGQYDPNSKYKVRNIANKYNYKGKILTIPYNTNFRDHYNDGNVKEFFSKYRNISKQDENSYFMQEVRETSRYLLTELGLNTQTKQIIEKGAFS
jgi:MinD-like ATPase involved in chromosome partitioning or flagellar assembly